MKIGATDITNCKIGSTQVNEVRIGSTLVWSAFTGLLDLYPGAIRAFAFFRLTRNYTGPLIRVRRSSDNAELDIGYNSSNELDTIALLSFVGVGNGFITTIYCQSGNAQDMTRSTAIEQPIIVSSGSLLTQGGKASCLFDGSNDYMTFTGFNATKITATGLYTYTAFNVLEPFFYSLENPFGTFNNNGFTMFVNPNNTTSGVNVRDGAANQIQTFTTSLNTQRLVTFCNDGAGVGSSTQRVFMNGTQTNNSTTFNPPSIISSNIFAVGRSGTGTLNVARFQFDGHFQHLILWDKDLLSDLPGINTALNNYYGIY